MASSPSPNGGNGRDARGRFALGNPGGPGNPHNRRMARFRAAMLRTVTVADVEAVVRMLVDKAKGGDLDAAKMLFDRVLGPVPRPAPELPAPAAPRTLHATQINVGGYGDDLLRRWLTAERQGQAADHEPIDVQAQQPADDGDATGHEPTA
jgi:hypothetical protein